MIMNRTRLSRLRSAVCRVTVPFLVGGMLAFGFPGLTEASAETVRAADSPRAPRLLLAQVDDTYDPFSDYSEFEQSMEEEEDINFFRNGRQLTVGFIGGYRGWTQDLGTVYSGDPAFGLFLSYFFDLRFALQFGYLSSDHSIAIPAGAAKAVTGNVSIGDLSFLLKYFFNTQNVTRGLADLNPYIVGGFSQIYRTTSISQSGLTSKDEAFAFNIGAGMEIPMLRNKMFFGAQGLYQLANFSDESSEWVDENGEGTGVGAGGDSFTVLAVLGVNF